MSNSRKRAHHWVSREGDRAVLHGGKVGRRFAMLDVVLGKVLAPLSDGGLQRRLGVVVLDVQRGLASQKHLEAIRAVSEGSKVQRVPSLRVPLPLCAALE